jgi:hypothetical protein
MSTWWPDLDDKSVSPEQRESRRDETLRKLKQKLDEIPEFTPQEAETLRWLIDTTRGWRFLAKGGRATFVLLAVIAAGVMSWDKLVGGFRSWLQP